MREMDPEEIMADSRAVEQLILHPAWAVVVKRLGFAIEEATEGLIHSNLQMEAAQGYRHRVLAFRELLDLPALIREQAKDASAHVSEGEPPTEGE